MKKIKLSDLTPDQLKALKEEVAADERTKAQKIAEDRKAYKELVNVEVPKLFYKLTAASEYLENAKNDVYDGIETLISLKSDAYGKTDDQYTHTFTTDAGITLIVGDRLIDGWDDTVPAGITKVETYLDTLVTNEDSAFLIKAVRKLLAKDTKGNLKSSRVLQLKQLADERGDPELIDGVSIIANGYRPKTSKKFVAAYYKDKDGVQHQVPLDITSCEVRKKEPAGGG